MSGTTRASPRDPRHVERPLRVAATATATLGRTGRGTTPDPSGLGTGSPRCARVGIPNTRARVSAHLDRHSGFITSTVASRRSNCSNSMSAR